MWRSKLWALPCRNFQQWYLWSIYVYAFLSDLPHFCLNDIQDLYNQPISKLVEFVVAAYHANPSMALEVFVHKTEKLQEEDKIGVS